MKERFNGLTVDIDLIKTGLAYVELQCKTSDGTVLAGVRVNGFCNMNKQSIMSVSNSAGLIKGYVVPAGAVTFSIDSMGDLTSSTTSLSNVVSGNKYYLDFILTPLNVLSITSTKNVYFSSRAHNILVTLVGGGGGGAGAQNHIGPGGAYWGINGGGGGGGNVAQFSYTTEINTSYPVTIGSGGSSGTDAKPDSTTSDVKVCVGRDGGTTTGFGASATGGKGGGSRYTSGSDHAYTSYGGSSDNGGSGGRGMLYSPGGSESHVNGSSGYNGSIALVDNSEKRYGGGGGGGNGTTDSPYPRYPGGASFGGTGASRAASASSGSDGYGGGGGGGAYNIGAGSFYNAARGGSGGCYIKFS